MAQEFNQYSLWELYQSTHRQRSCKYALGAMQIKASGAKRPKVANEIYLTVNGSVPTSKPSVLKRPVNSIHSGAYEIRTR